MLTLPEIPTSWHDNMRFLVLILFILPCLVSLADEPPIQARQKADQKLPLNARDELRTFQLDPRFTIELVAAEPDIVDPVCFCFDARGDLYVVEMRGYPNGGKGEGKPNLAGRVRKLQDKDGDGYYETSTIFVDQLRFPCGITPWRNGFLIGDAPDLIFVEDTKGEGVATLRRTLYTGFGNSNIQQMINGLQFHPDGWIHGCNGGNDSPVRSVEKPESPVVQLRGMHFRFKPDVPGSLEPTSGGGQYGLAANENGHWFTCTNSQHLRHIVLPYRYLRRNPSLAVSSVTLDIPDHGAAARVFRISPFEAWRVERTSRRAGSVDAKRFPSTELTPGGFITSASGLAVYDGGIFPPAYHGNVFVCDPANNLIHRDILVPSGSTYRAERHDKDCDFLASTDTWFRPVFLANGPDGALYVADFYREIIETPLSLPDDIKARWNLNSRERGRIWRIKARQKQPSLARFTSFSEQSASQLVRELTSPIGWRAQTASRMLTEKGPGDQTLSAQLKQLVNHQDPSVVRYALSLLQHWQQLDEETLSTAIQSKQRLVPVILRALQLAESFPKLSDSTTSAIQSLASDEQYHIRFQLALSLGSLPLQSHAKRQLAEQLLSQPNLDSWCETAVLSSMKGIELDVLRSPSFQQNARLSTIEKVAQLVRVAVPGNQLLEDSGLRKRLDILQDERKLAVLFGLGAEYCKNTPELIKTLNQILHTSESNTVRRMFAIKLLGYFTWHETESLFRLILAPQVPFTEQQIALQAMKNTSDPDVARFVLSMWSNWSPNLRREAQELLLSRPAFINLLLDHAEAGTFSWQQLDLARREVLMRSRTSTVKQRSLALQSKTATASRIHIIKKYDSVLQLNGDASRGKTLFVKHCSTCHQFQGQGHPVGPELQSALGNKTTEALMIDVLDPNREVDPRYVNYVVVTKAGQTKTGVISEESASSITLKRAEGIQETILRSDIEDVQATGKSLMPENLDEQLTPQELSDVIKYLLESRTRK